MRALLRAILVILLSLACMQAVVRAVVRALEPPRPAAADQPGQRASCKRAEHPVRVILSRRRWPHVADHVADVRGRYPRVLHVDRRHADARREASLRGVPTRPGVDRDEYPPATSAEGGKGADVRYVASSENRSAGGYLGGRLRPFCSGQRFVILARR